MFIYQLKPEGAVNNWLLARLRMRFNVLLCHDQCMFICKRSCFFNGCTSSLASHAATQLLVVTISFVVAANTTTLKPFNTAMG